MTLRDISWHAWTHLRKNIRRSLIAMTGLALGIAALVALETLGRTTSFFLMSFIERLGQARVVRVRAVGLKELGLGARAFTFADVDRLRDDLLGVAIVEPIVTAFDARVECGGRWLPARVSGVGESYLDLLSLKVAQGRFITPEDGQRSAAVAVLGSDLGELIDAERGGPGTPCMVAGVAVRVVGILDPSIFEDANRSVFVSLPTALSRFYDNRRLDTLLVRAGSLNGVRPLATTLREHLRARDPHRRQTYEVRVNESALKQIEDALRVLAIFVWVVSLVTLLLGGFGIMNAFLASVAERTTELGIRKAVGATEEAILAEILAEALALCLTASVIGLGLGLLIMRSMVAATGHPELAAVAPLRVLAIALFGSAVGTLFALLPALRAANKDVIDAIRST